jgi:phosphoribosylglycinamide formyltransferase-1
VTGPGVSCKLLVLLSGNGSNLQAIIDQVERGRLNANIAAVISDQAQAYGLQRAAIHHIPAVTLVANSGESRESYDARLHDTIDQYQADWIIMAGFMRILSDEFVNRHLGQLINIHPSLLPHYKGLNTHQRVLEAGETQHGASVHFVTPALDDGPVISQARIAVHEDETADALKQRVHQVEHQLYPAAIELLCEQRLAYNDGKVQLDGKMIDSPLITDLRQQPAIDKT